MALQPPPQPPSPPPLPSSRPHNSSVQPCPLPAPKFPAQPPSNFPAQLPHKPRHTDAAVRGGWRRVQRSRACALSLEQSEGSFLPPRPGA